MDPLQLMNNDMATLKMSSERVFDLWQDDVAASLRDKCVGTIQTRWNRYMNEMNTYTRNYMHAEQEIEETLSRLEKMVNDDN